MIESEEMSFLLFNLCNDMNKNGLDYDEEFEVLLLWDEELKDSYYHIFEMKMKIQIIVNIIKFIMKIINIKLYNNKVI